MDNMYVYDEQVCNHLNEIEKMLINTFSLNVEDVEILALKVLSNMFSRDKELVEFSDIINKHLETYNREMVTKTDSDWCSGTQFIIPTIRKKVGRDYSLALPSMFETYKLVYILCYNSINEEFDKINKLDLSRKDKFLIENLNKTIKNILVKNPNMNGDIPYYQRNINMLFDSKKTWKKFLLKDIQNIKDLFSDNENDF